MRMIPHCLRPLNNWSPVGGDIWGNLGRMDLLDEVCHWGVGFESGELPTLSLLSLSQVCI